MVSVWTFLGLGIGYLLLGNIVSNLVNQLVSQAEGALGSGAAAIVDEPSEEYYEEEY